MSEPRGDGVAEELLFEVLVGDRSPDDPEVRARAAGDEAFRSELEALLETQEDVRATARLEREVLRDVDGRAVDLATADARVEAVLRRLAAEEGVATPVPVPGRARLLRFWPLAAAAAVLVAFFLTRGGRDEPAPAAPGDELVLGPEAGVHGMALQTPIGPGASFEVFRWDHDLDPGQRFELRVLDPATGAELLDPVQVDEPTWRPDPDVAAAWPDEIAWEVSVVSVLDHIERTSERATASR